MVYHFYFESAGRAYNLKLSNDQQEQIQILSKADENGIHLLELNLDKMNLISCYGTDNDIEDIKISSIDVTDYLLNINLSRTKPKESPFEETERPPFRIIKEKDKDGNKLEIRSCGKETEETFTIRFVFEDNKQEYTADVIINSFPDEQIYDVVLDFGSEASQMYAEEKSVLFNNCAQHFYGIMPKDIKARTYHQQEDSGKEEYEGKLFRSIFFLAKDARNEENAVLQKPGKDDPLLSFITRRDNQDEKGERLPNIKISYLSGTEYYHDIQLKILHQAIVMRFIHEAVMEIQKKMRNNKKGTHCAIRITILVPNVMNHSQVFNLIDDIRQNTRSEAFLELLPDNMKKTIFDVRPYSESDASFAFWYEQHWNEAEPGYYLMIDVGKGTTDFSIIHVENLKNAISVYRSGFIGAGNALTYAYFENQIASMVGTTQSEKYIQKILSKAEPAKLFELENIIEEFKRHPEDYPAKKPEGLKDDMMADAIIEKIKDIGLQPDESKIILSTIHDIIEKIVVNVKVRDFQKVILSGRAFKHPRFRVETQKILRKFYDLTEDPVYEEEQAKYGCLTGPLTKIHINMSTDMTAAPVKVDATQRNNVEKHLKNDFNKIIKELQKEEADTTDIEKFDSSKSHLAWQTASAVGMAIYKPIGHVWSGVCSLFSGSSSSGVDNTINMNGTTDEIVEIMLSEKRLGTCDQNTLFYIADDKYMGEEELENKEYRLFFDGESFYVRDDNRNIRLVPCEERINTDMLYESLFPYSHKVLGSDANVPKIAIRKK